MEAIWSFHNYKVLKDFLEKHFPERKRHEFLKGNYNVYGGMVQVLGRRIIFREKVDYETTKR